MFCIRCGRKTVTGAAFCAYCGAPIGGNARRATPQVLAVAGVLVLAAGGAVLYFTAARPQAVKMSSQPAPSVATTPAGAAADAVPAQGQAQSPAPVAPVHLDTQAAESAAATLAQRPSAPPGTAAATKPALPTSSGSDRYPGSQPVTVDNANLPNIGIPVATEVYSTTDSVPTVVNYYKQRYPDGQVMEVNGQQVIAVDRPSGAKVIAVGTTGSETRIAIVRPAS